MNSEGGEGIEHQQRHHTTPESSKRAEGPRESPARPVSPRTAEQAREERAIEETQHALQILPVPESRNMNLADVEAVSLTDMSHQEQMRILENWSIHDMPMEVKLWLAEEHQIYTTTEPRDPGSLREFLKQRETERQLERLRDNAINALRKYPAFKNEEHLGRRLRSIFDAVTDVKVEGVSYDFEDPQKKYDKPPVAGTAKAKEITYTVATKDEADLLHYTFKALLKTNSDEEYPVLVPKEKDGQYTITVCNMTEYTNRVLGNAIDQIVAQEDVEETETILPNDKKPLVFWQAIDEETFHPDVQARLKEQDDKYHILAPTIKKYPFLLGSDASAVFAIVRDAFRPIIHKYRGGDYRNLEQNPDKEKRLWIENGVNLIRPPAKSQEDVEVGPKTARALSKGQHLRAHAETSLKQAMKDKTRAIGTGIVKGISGGVESLMEFGLLSTLSIPRLAAKMDDDIKRWEEQKDKVADSREEIAKILMEELLAEPV